MKNLWRMVSVWVYGALPLILFFAAWYLVTSGSERRTFFFGSPYLYLVSLLNGILTGSLLKDTFVTGSEAVIGFLIGNVTGAVAGFMLWKSPKTSRALRPYIIVLGSAPLFAFAPIIIIWFGTGFSAKVVVAVLSTMFVALMQAFNGAEQADPTLAELIRSFGGNENVVFRKVVIPSSLVWVIAGFRLNVGLALLGAFLGEYISSEAGLGHLILVAGGLYNIPRVLVGVTMIGFLGLILSWAVGVLGRNLRKRLVSTL
ncbi:MAG: NitT/TauT family transport system permease protein [Blastocatellia bacterium]|jgi:NitT/TauT family transport system permease protein|nr:NitT/TauT family transport system permease protein [Blastocatellia bacterium]